MLVVAVLHVGNVLEIPDYFHVGHDGTEHTEQKHEDEKVERDPVDLPVQTTQLVPIPVLIQHQL